MLSGDDALVLTCVSFQHLLQLHRISHPFISPPTCQWAFSFALQEVCVKSHVSPSMTIFNHAPSHPSPPQLPHESLAGCLPKPARAHHCSVCGTCQSPTLCPCNRRHRTHSTGTPFSGTLRMDHHCPFIGNCVGLHNHRSAVRSVTSSETAFVVFATTIQYSRHFASQAFLPLPAVALHRHNCLHRNCP